MREFSSAPAWPCRGLSDLPAVYAGLVGTRAALGALRDADTVIPLSLADRIKELLGP